MKSFMTLVGPGIILTDAKNKIKEANYNIPITQ